MQENPKNALVYKQFGGWSPHADPREIGLGAKTLTNMTLNVPGQLTSRLGHTAMSQSNGQASTTESVIALFRYETPSYTYAVYETSDGAVRIARSPS